MRIGVSGKAPMIYACAGERKSPRVFRLLYRSHSGALAAHQTVLSPESGLDTLSENSGVNGD